MTFEEMNARAARREILVENFYGWGLKY